VKPQAFRSAAAFRAWLEKHHATERELIMRLYKSHARAKGLGYSEALDQALCFGWIDGVRRALDEDSFTQRFTPRRTGSVWSAINIKRVEDLEARGLMHEAGRAAFRVRQKGPAPYSFEAKQMELSPALLRRLKANRRAWEFHSAQPPGYRRICTFYVMSAKQEATRVRRLDVLIGRAARGERLPMLGSPAKGKKK
jgi:uncharacterized protein YdeI (YjbR/CyaY-like superfamily)